MAHKQVLRRLDDVALRLGGPGRLEAEPHSSETKMSSPKRSNFTFLASKLTGSSLGE